MSILSGVFKSLGKKIFSKASWIIPLVTLIARRRKLKSVKKKATPPTPEYANAVAILSFVPSLRSALPMPTVGMLKGITDIIPNTNPAFQSAIANQLVRNTPMLNLMNIRNSLSLYDLLHDITTKAMLREAEASGQGTVAYNRYKQQVNDWTANALMGWWYSRKLRNNPFVISDWGESMTKPAVSTAMWLGKAFGWW